MQFVNPPKAEAAEQPEEEQPEEPTPSEDA